MYPFAIVPRQYSLSGHINNVLILMGKKNHDKKDMKHNMFGEHSNGRRNLSHKNNEAATLHDKEMHLHNTPPIDKELIEE